MGTPDVGHRRRDGDMKHQLTRLSTERPRTVYLMVLVLTLALGALIPRIHVDTDPENMLPADQPDRVFHNLVEQRFTLHDAIVVGAVNEDHPDGVFNPESLSALVELTDAILAMDGVIDRDLMSLSTADNITQAGPGTIRFEWMMQQAPGDATGALAIRDAVDRLPLLENTLVSGDGKAAAIYVPIESKDLSYDVSQQIQAVVDGLDSPDDYYITGLPVAFIRIFFCLCHSCCRVGHRRGRYRRCIGIGITGVPVAFT